MGFRKPFEKVRLTGALGARVDQLPLLGGTAKLRMNEKLAMANRGQHGFELHVVEHALARCRETNFDKTTIGLNKRQPAWVVRQALQEAGLVKLERTKCVPRGAHGVPTSHTHWYPFGKT